MDCYNPPIALLPARIGWPARFQADSLRVTERFLVVLTALTLPLSEQQFGATMHMAEGTGCLVIQGRYKDGWFSGESLLSYGRVLAKRQGSM